MDEHNQLLVTLNQAGIDLTDDEIDSVLNLEDRQRNQKENNLLVTSMWKKISLASKCFFATLKLIR